jgi:hypothetical protein
MAPTRLRDQSHKGLMVGITYCFVKPFVAARGSGNCLYS